MLVLDNLAGHKLAGVRELLAERGVELLFLPPYSPDFSLVEQALYKAIDWINSQDAQNWFNHCGYPVKTAT